GVDATRMEDIADEAGLQRPNLYRYFPTKGEVIRGAIIQETHATHAVRRKKVPLDGPVAPLLVKSLTIGLELARKNEIIAFNLSSGAIDVTVAMLAGDELVLAAEAEYWGPLLAHGRQRRELRKELPDERIIRWFLTNQFFFLDRPQLFEAGGTKQWISEFVVPAVLSPRGLAALD
ncbi:MAG: TetR/AcrR family transcriptional regulator, partial [Acidimicrobiia bacterium]